MKKVIVTVGPSFIHDNIIRDYHSDNYIYRINGAHGTIKDIETYITLIRTQVPSAKILVDLPGNKIRTSRLDQPIVLKKNTNFFLSYEQTNFPDYYKYLSEGDIVYANDSIFMFEVKSISNGFIEFTSHSNGILKNNKGMHVRGINEKIPFLFDKDRSLIKLANEYEVAFVGLSFVRHKNDLLEAKRDINNCSIICKIETKLAVKNINELLDANEFFLVDRGDLSTEVGLTQLSYYQRYIMEKAIAKNRSLFLATQFLKNMEENPIPSIAEIIDLVNTMKQGITGIQLSEETAVGKYPIECLKIVKEVLESIENE